MTTAKINDLNWLIGKSNLVEYSSDGINKNTETSYLIRCRFAKKCWCFWCSNEIFYAIWITSVFFFQNWQNLTRKENDLCMKSMTLWPNDHQQYDWHGKRNKLKQQRLHNTHTHISSSNHFSISNQSKTNRMAFKKQQFPFIQKIK